MCTDPHKTISPHNNSLTTLRVSRHLALHLAPAYGLSELVMALCKAVPDPHVSYRKSQRSQAAADEIARSSRQAQQVTTAAAAASTSRPAPSMTAEAAEAPTPKRRRADTQEGGERRLTLEATTTVTAPAGTNVDMDAEIESAKQLVRDLKRELQLRTAAGDELEETGGAAESSASGSRGRKRAANDEGTAVSGGAAAGTERVIRTNKRVEKTDGPVQTVKRVAFGAMLFGLGASAAL